MLTNNGFADAMIENVINKTITRYIDERHNLENNNNNNNDSNNNKIVI